MRKITDNVYVEDRYSVQPYNQGCNPGFVTTSDGIVMVDTPMWTRHAVAWRDDIAKIGKVRYIINTHHHGDHMAGNYLFTAPIIAHEGVREANTKVLTGIFLPSVLEKAQGRPLTGEETTRLDIEDRDPESIPFMAGFRIRPPDITFSERLNLYVGGHTFELIFLPGHTGSHIGVYVPEEKVFFAGDNFTNATQPAFSSCLPLEWVESLKKIEAMDVALVVPGHGRVGGKKEVREFRLFLEKCIKMVRDAIRKGMTREEAAEKISFESSLPAVHPGAGQQRYNVLRLYEMLSPAK